MRAVLLLLLVACAAGIPVKLKESAPSKPEWKRGRYYTPKEELNEEETPEQTLEKRLEDGTRLKTVQQINEEKNLALTDGDIILTPQNLHDLGKQAGDWNQRRRKRSTTRDLRYLWVDRKIPYEISPDLSAMNELILEVMSTIENMTCLKFVTRTDQSFWIRFTKGVGCTSNVGRQYEIPNQGQNISLADTCAYDYLIMHEIFHSLGLWHEQNRYDRDDYVEIMWEDILDGREGNFHKKPITEIDNLGINYDIHSLMHYGKYDFSRNGKPTIRDITNPDGDVGGSTTPTTLDWMKINALYHCTISTGGWSDWSSYSPCDDSCVKSRQRFCFAVDKAADCPEADSYGVHTKNTTCTYDECHAPVDGHWSPWSTWSRCSNDCGQGTRDRSRVCDDPAPENGGNDCPGSATQSETCSGPCEGSRQDDCSFAYHTCLWSQDVNDQFDWSRTNGLTPSQYTGPYGGSSGSSEDYYLFIEASSPRVEGDKARLLSRVLPGIDEARCLIFSYHMYGLYMGSLKVYHKNLKTGVETMMWTVSGNKGFNWYTGKIPFTSVDDFQLAFEGVRGPSHSSDMAIDDVKLWWGQCSDPQEGPPAESPPLPRILSNCNFTDGMCGWSNQASGVDLNWQRTTGSTPTTGTGPSTDHTLRTTSGHYLFIESSSPAVKGNRARLVSGDLVADYGCMTFWYHMLGSGMGDLKVISQKGSDEELIWKLSGDQGYEWGQASVPLDITAEHKIIFEAVRGNDYRSDIAIDDIEFTDGNRCITVPKAAEPIADCDFEEGTCFWSSSNTADFDWTLGTGSTPTGNTGPSSDHTTGLGQYMFIETSDPRVAGDKAALVSPRIEPGPHCFHLWYNMNGASIGSLEVFQKTDVSTSVYQISGNQNDVWNQAQISINSTQPSFLIIEGTRGSSWLGDIAIDDVSLTDGSCD